MAKEPQAEQEAINPAEFNQCWTCKFSKPKENDRFKVRCHRFPRTVDKSINGWCGEFAQ